MQLKTVFVGPHGSWKARFLYTLLQRQWPESGVTPLVAGETRDRFELWETSGKPERRQERELIYSGARLFVFCFNAAEAKSLESFEPFYAECKAACPDAPVVMMGNKQAGDVRAVREERVHELFGKIPIMFCDDVCDLESARRYMLQLHDSV